MPDDRYALLVRSVWQAIERKTGWPPCYLSRDRIGGYCPVGCGGTLAVQFLDSPPRAQFETYVGAADDRCSFGCTAQQIFKALE